VEEDDTRVAMIKIVEICTLHGPQSVG